MRDTTRQVIAILALTAFVCFIVFSAIGLAITVSHTCVGIHCRACERIAVVEQAAGLLKAVGLLLAFALFVCRTLSVLSARVLPLCPVQTIVTLKTKLSN